LDQFQACHSRGFSGKSKIIMAKIFITGSADGLGHLTAKMLVSEGHEVVLHARNDQRGRDAMTRVPGAKNVVIGDLSDIIQTRSVAKQVNDFGRFDAVIHNAGVYQTDGKVITAVNTLAPYILTCLIDRPSRLIYLSSGMHKSGQPNFQDIKDYRVSYSDSKLHVVMLANAVARKWKEVLSNSLDPGWVPTKMGGHNAPDDLVQGYETQAWLAVSNDEAAKVSGQYFHHKKISRHQPAADDANLQEKLLAVCEEITGVKFPP
jgi:NAD(P)-dependent dehydrogenase (short-subunit alcohol dehydrogenase family)